MTIPRELDIEIEWKNYPPAPDVPAVVEPTAENPDRPTLSMLQLQVLAECASGGTMGTAARKLYYSYSSVNRAVISMKKTLGARTMTQCAMAAHTHGMLSVPTGSDLRCYPIVS